MSDGATVVCPEDVRKKPCKDRIMSAFINENFMLSSETARRLFHDHAGKLPIIDYHCHLSPREIAENIRFRDITQLWLVDGHSATTTNGAR